MPGPFHGINLVGNALRSFQRAMDVTGHNIANVNTRGYSRQAIDFAQIEPSMYGGASRFALGEGVAITSVNRIRDMFLEGRLNDATGARERFSTLAGHLREIGGVYNEPGDSGISAALDRFFDGWSALASNPAERANRLALQQAGQTLADRIRGAFRDLDGLQVGFQQQVDGTIAQINDLAGRIATLNEQVRQQRALGAEPNDLMDMRDLAVAELATLVNVHTHEGDDGTLTVHSSQFTLVDRAGANAYPSSYDPVSQTVSDSKGTYAVRSGRLLGLFQSITQTRSQMGQLDLIANNLRAEVNALHFTGIDENGNTGVLFFNGPPPPYPPDPNTMTGAIDFDLSAAVKADPGAIASGTTGNAGDGGLALLLSRLRDAPINAKTNGTSILPGLGGRTFSAYYRDSVSGAGEMERYYSAARDTESAVVSQIEQQQASIAGVSLDDEMASMMRFQRSYQAAARALTVFDQVTEDLIGMLRR